MLASNNFKKTKITLDRKEFDMEYDLAKVMEGSVRGFGNIYTDSEEPMEFTFFTLNNKIAGYTPMNGTKEFIGSIVSAVLGHELPFED